MLFRRVTALKRDCLKALPHVLFIQLKRFEFDYDTLLNVKLNDRCEFPASLNIYPYTKEYNMHYEDDYDTSSNSQSHLVDRYRYDLVGIVIHQGTSDSGHYYSFVKNRSGDSSDAWYEYNDTRVTPFDFSKLEETCFGGTDVNGRIRHNNAYMLVYEKRDKTATDGCEVSIEQHTPLLEKIKKMRKGALNANNLYSYDYLDFLLKMMSSNGDKSASYRFAMKFMTRVYESSGKENRKIFSKWLTSLKISSVEDYEWTLDHISSGFKNLLVLPDDKTVRQGCLEFIKDIFYLLEEDRLNDVLGSVKKMAQGLAEMIPQILEGYFLRCEEAFLAINYMIAQSNTLRTEAIKQRWIGTLFQVLVVVDDLQVQSSRRGYVQTVKSEVCRLISGTMSILIRSTLSVESNPFIFSKGEVQLEASEMRLLFETNFLSRMLKGMGGLAHFLLILKFIVWENEEYSSKVSKLLVEVAVNDREMLELILEKICLPLFFQLEDSIAKTRTFSFLDLIFEGLKADLEDPLITRLYRFNIDAIREWIRKRNKE
jgi:hypothetical protein